MQYSKYKQSYSWKIQSDNVDILKAFCKTMFLLRGRPFDSEGGGSWHFWSGQIIYFHHVLGRKIYFRVNRGQNIYFLPQQIFEKAKKKAQKKGGGGSARV